MLTVASPPALSDISRVSGNKHFTHFSVHFSSFCCQDISISAHPINNATRNLFLKYFAHVRLSCFSKKIVFIWRVVQQNFCDQLQLLPFEPTFKEIQHAQNMYVQYTAVVECSDTQLVFFEFKWHFFICIEFIYDYPSVHSSTLTFLPLSFNVFLSSIT